MDPRVDKIITILHETIKLEKFKENGGLIICKFELYDPMNIQLLPIISARIYERMRVHATMLYDVGKSILKISLRRPYADIEAAKTLVSISEY